MFEVRHVKCGLSYAVFWMNASFDCGSLQEVGWLNFGSLFWLIFSSYQMKPDL